MAGKGPNTYFKGSKPIDGIWTTTEIEVTSATYLPYDPELGDHRPVIANLSKRLGQEYIDRLEEQMRSHKVLNRLQRLQAEAEGEFR